MKLNEKADCPKCGFKPTFQEKWKVQYKDKCYVSSTCGWKDSEVDEHLHQECPTCGYTFAVETADYDKLKNKDVWNSAAGSDLGKVTTPPTVNGGRGGMGGVKEDVKPLIASCTANRSQAAPVQRIPQPTTVYTPPKPARCRTCPVEAKNADTNG